MNPRRRVSPRAQRGQGTIEFQIIAVLVLIPILLAVIQTGMLVIAKNTVNVAALGTARAGAASGGSQAAMNDALAVGLLPLYASDAKATTGVGMNDINAGNYVQVAGAAFLKSKAMNLLWSRITVLNPTTKSFQDFGVDRPDGKRVIPVRNMYDSTKVGATSSQTHSDALLLKIEVRYCHKMAIPIISEAISKFLSNPILLPKPEDLLCYADDRVPLISQAVVRMTVPPVRQQLLGR